MASKPINISFPLRRSPSGAFQTNSTTLEAVRDDLKILLLSNYGERPCRYNFGANLRQVVFSQQGPNLIQEISDRIVSAINTWMPFVAIDDISVETNSTNKNLENNQIKIKLSFSVGQLAGVLEQSIQI